MIPFYKSRLISNYNMIDELEDKFAEYTGFNFAIAVDSCTSAIKLSLMVKKHIIGESVSIPACTYVSVANEIIMQGKRVIFDDRICVGRPYELGATGIFDSAHAVDQDSGRFYHADEMYCYSFYPTKLCPSYQGGMICTNSKYIADKLKYLRQMGRTDYGPSYDVVSIGPKCNMTPIQAYEALRSLKRLPKVKVDQSNQAAYYHRNIPAHVVTPHLFVAKVPEGIDIDHLLAYAILHGVQLSRHFKPIYRFTAYESMKVDPKYYPVSEMYYNTAISLPIYPGLKKRDQDKVIKLLRGYIYGER